MIIRLVEDSHLPVRRTLQHRGIPPATFSRWTYRYQAGGLAVLADRTPRPDRVWNRVPDTQRATHVDLALAASRNFRHASWR